MITANLYQVWTPTTAIYPKEIELEYLALGLTSEAGEVAGKVKKFFRDKGDRDKLVEDLNAELGDCMWYISQLANHLGLNLEGIMQSNHDKLESRKQLATLSGSGDNR